MAAEPVSPEVAPTMVARCTAPGEDVIHHPGEELHRHVLERQRRPVEQLEHEVPGLELHKRRHGRVTEGGVGLIDDAAKLGVGDFTLDEAAR